MEDGQKNDALQSFLEKHVELNEGREDRMESGISTVTSLVQKNEPFSDLFLSISKQGSYRLETAIKPVKDNDDFDLDLLLLLERHEDWEPKDYLNELHRMFKEMDRYKDKVDRRGKTRCVTLDYDDDFHIDLVPSVKIDGQLMITNKNTNGYELTDGDGYANWFGEKNSVTGGHLAQVVQLLKYLRDHKRTFTIKSIVLTTLLAMMVRDTDTEEEFPNLVTTLQVLSQRLDDFLQAHSVMPDIYNPVLPLEKFTERHWDQDLYENFRQCFHRYTEQIQEAIDADLEAYERLMKTLFGDVFTLEKSVKNVSTPIICDGLDDHSHRIDPIWPERLRNEVAVHLSAELLHGGIARPVESGKFHAWAFGSKTSGTNDTMIFSADVSGTHGAYEVFWQVVNTGAHARNAKCLRGDKFFHGPTDYPSHDNDQHVHHETVEYNGVHFVECFVVQAGVLIARSGPFFVKVVNTSFGRYKKPPKNFQKTPGSTPRAF